MIRNKHDEQKICQIHNLPLEFLNPDKSKPNQLYVCNQCFIEYHKAIPIQQCKESNQSIIKQFEQQLEYNYKIWNMSIHSLISLSEVFTKSIKIIEYIKDVIRNQIQQTKNEFNNMNVNYKDRIQQAHESYLQTQLTYQRNIIQQIEELKQNSSITNLIQGLNEISLQQLNCDDQNQKINNEEIQKKLNENQVPLNSVQQLKVKYEYQLIPESTLQQEEICTAIAFNYDGSIIVAGCYNIINVFEFKNNQLKKVQQLNSHEDTILCLKFMKKSNYFISGSRDTTINIWYVNSKNQYINTQTLKEHKGCINCIIINSNDELIVSGSSDKSIIFLRLNGNKWQRHQQIKCYSNVYSLSFSDSNTKLISCEDITLIQVFELQGKEWIISQVIQIEQRGVGLCFISDDQFVFLPWVGKQLYFYKFDLQTDKFEKVQEVVMSNSDKDYSKFPIKFIRSKNLLIVKNCQFVNILRRQENFALIQDQSIEYKTENIFVDVSEDGNFMVTWDFDTYGFQVRYFKKIQ